MAPLSAPLRVAVLAAVVRQNDCAHREARRADGRAQLAHRALQQPHHLVQIRHPRTVEDVLLDGRLHQPAVDHHHAGPAFLKEPGKDVQNVDLVAAAI
eukprot:scaffold1231_cov187-Pinguiococcus_pyrenoidosus.AAC.9